MTSQVGLFDSVAAHAAREQGMLLALDHADADWRRRVERAVVALAQRGEGFTTDDVRHWVGDPPRGTHYNAMGAIVSALAKRGIIRQIGYAKSARVIGHGNLVRRWIGR